MCPEQIYTPFDALSNPSCPLLKQAISSRSEGRLKPSPNREDIVDDTITTIYCLCDEFLKAIHHQDDAQVRLTTAEVMTVPLVAATFFGANLDKTRRFLHEYGYMRVRLHAKDDQQGPLQPPAARHRSGALAGYVRAFGRSLQAK